MGCLFPAMIPAQVFINEISICNVSQQLDPNFDYTGWIELYNASTTDLNIRDLYFSDEVNNPLKYKLKSNRILPAGGFALVWLNDEIKGRPTVGGGWSITQYRCR
ncbi:MAG: lamin tail domain-containing protein [Bacteroidaceae bacterium]